MGQNLLVLHQDAIDLPLQRQFLGIIAVVVLVAALISAKFLIAPSFEQHPAFPTVTFRKVKIHMNQTRFEGLSIYRAVSRGRNFFPDPKKSSFNSVKYAVKEHIGSKLCNA
jgi:hypothetical protein